MRQNGFIHIPKTGGTTLNSTALGRYQTEVPPHRSGGISTKRARWHRTAEEVRKDEVFRNFFLYTIMRNPYDRLISCFHASRRCNFDHLERAWRAIDGSKSVAEAEKIFVNLSLKTYVRYITGNSDRGELTHILWTPQSQWIKDEKGNVIVDYIGRTETLMKNINEISQILGEPLKLTQLDRQNESPRWKKNRRRGKTGHYSKHFDAECRKMAEEYYAEDIEFLKADYKDFLL